MSPAPALSTVLDPGPERPTIGRRDGLAALGYAALVLVLAASGASNTGFFGEAMQPPVWASVTAMLVAAASILFRRRHPVIVLAVAGPLGLAEVVFGGQLSGYLLLFEALFEPVIHGSRRLARTTTGLAGAVTAAAFVVAMALTGVGPHLLAIVLVAVLVVMTPLLWGWEVRHHRDARRSAETLAGAEHELAATRAAHAVETERRTIAQDLHDVIAGHLSAVALHTSLATSLEDEHTRDRSLVTARESAQAALRDLRSMIGVLASEESGSLPTATLDWDSLTERLRGRDPQARVAIDPSAADPARVDPSVQAALLRIAAEAATNAVNHGRAPIVLEVRVPGDEVTLSLVNQRSVTSAAPDGVGRGAIAHRAAAVGGSATSAPAPENEDESGTWRVDARLPAHPPVPGDGPAAAAASTSNQEVTP